MENWSDGLHIKIEWMDGAIEMMEEIDRWNDGMMSRGAIDQIKWWIIEGVKEL